MIAGHDRATNRWFTGGLDFGVPELVDALDVHIDGAQHIDDRNIVDDRAHIQHFIDDAQLPEVIASRNRASAKVRAWIATVTTLPAAPTNSSTTGSALPSCSSDTTA